MKVLLYAVFKDQRVRDIENLDRDKPLPANRRGTRIELRGRSLKAEQYSR
jgi:hypothetical protein